MKRLLILAAVVVAAGAQASITTFDSISNPGTSYFTSGSTPRTSFADDWVGASSGQMDTLAFGFAFNSTATFYDFIVRIKIYNGWNGTATGTTSVVGSQVGSDIVLQYTGFTSGGAYLSAPVNVLANNINVVAGQQYSWSEEFFDVTGARVSNDRVTPLFNENPVTVGSSADINYVRDGAAGGDGLNGVYVGGELRSVGVPFVMAGSFTVVPEPASMVAMGLGLLALARRRRKA